MMALKHRREIFRGLRNSLGLQQKFPTSLSQCTWSHSPASSSSPHCIACSAEGTLPAERPRQIQRQAHWKLQAQALPHTRVHLSQQMRGRARRSGRGNCCLPGKRLQIAQCSSGDTANLAIATPSCTETASPHPFQNWYHLTFCSIELCCLMC